MHILNREMILLLEGIDINKEKYDMTTTRNNKHAKNYL